MMNKQLLSTTGLILAIILFIAFNIVTTGNLKSARVDLTADNLYTLSEGTLNILDKLEELITLRFYYTEQVAQELPTLKAYATRVQELLGEYQRAAKGNIKLQIIDPKPYSDDEERAKQYGLQGVPISGETDPMYFGLVGNNLLDGLERITFFQPEKEDVLEYDLTKLIYTLSNVERKTVGVLSALEVNGEEYDPLKGYAPSADAGGPWPVMNALRELFNVDVLPNDIRRIPSTMDVLLIIHPKDFSTDTLYAIDQYVLKGGKVIAFVDPYAEIDIPEKDPDKPMAAMMTSRSSNMPELFKAWGIERVSTDIVADLKTAEQVNFGANSNHQAIDYVLWQGLVGDQFNQDQVITRDLRKVVMATPGRFKILEDTDMTVIPLLSSTNEAMLIDKRVVQFRNNPMALLTKYQPGTISYPMAVWVKGISESAFPDGLPDASGKVAKPPGHVDKATESIDVIAVADVDMLQDRFWVQLQDFYGEQIAYSTANNIDFLVNSLDVLAGSNGLVSVRSRAGFSRPFHRVLALQRDADKRYLTKERELKKTLKETEQFIARLQSERGDGDSDTLLTAEQQQELETHKVVVNKTRQQLREVQSNLRKDINQLDAKVKFFNIGLVPIIVAIFALITGWMRVKKRTQGRTQQA